MFDHVARWGGYERAMYEPASLRLIANSATTSVKSALPRRVDERSKAAPATRGEADSSFAVLVLVQQRARSSCDGYYVGYYVGRANWLLGGTSLA